MIKKIIKSGDLFIWFTGFGLAITLIMIAGLLLIITANGSEYFLPSKIIQVRTTTGENFAGEINQEEEIPIHNSIDSATTKTDYRIKLKTGNRDLYGFDFKWFDKNDIVQSSYPDSIALIERVSFGNFYGFITKLKRGDSAVYSLGKDLFDKIEERLKFATDIRNQITDLEKNRIGSINYQIESIRNEIQKIQFNHLDSTETGQREIKNYNSKIANLQTNYLNLEKEDDSLKTLAGLYSIVVKTAEGSEKEILLSDIINIFFPNKMSLLDKARFIFDKIAEFLFSEPRESNTEGGVFPAIFGTIMMVILMSIFAVPLGVITALYMREYAKQGFTVQTVRIAVNNLAGVPSIVFGVFGLGFFIYFVGGTIDQLFYPEKLPTPTWGTGGILWASLTLALLTVPVVIVSTEEALASIPRGIREAALALGSTKWQVIRKIVLPSAMPGILTGIILAMARGAGEVAPLMITGVVKLAPSLPLDSNFPFFHLDRKFMHLGFHIYDVGFQSPNVEAALPMVYMTTLLLIFIVILLNIFAMLARNRLRKKYQSSTF